MRNFKAVLCYDGARYRGWQKQGNTANTIQERVEQTLCRILGQEVEAAGSGRTDAGTHALGQVISFRAETDLTAEALLRQLRAALPRDIGAVSLADAPPRFHARLSATGKRYRYRIWNADAPCVFERNYVWIVPEPLDIDAMRAAAKLLTGTHDFAAFCTQHSKKKSTVRTVTGIALTREGNELRLDFTGDGFLYNMVRILTGTIVQVGRGEKTPEDAARLLSSLDRAQAGPTAPAQGLCLMEVFY